MLFHLPLLYAFSRETAEGYVYILAVLTALFADLVLSFYQTELLTAKRDSLRAHIEAFVPYFPEKCAVIAAEFGIYYLLQADSGAEERLRYLICWLFCMGTGLLSAVVTFVTGAARTALFHEEKGK